MELLLLKILKLILMYLATTPCAFRTRGSHRYRYIGKIHVSRRRTFYLFFPRTIRRVRLFCGTADRGTTEPKEMTVFITTAFG